MANHRKAHREARNRRVWQCIHEYTRRFGFAPSYHELEALLGCGTAVVNSAVVDLVKQGRIAIADVENPFRSLIVRSVPKRDPDIVALIAAYSLPIKSRSTPLFSKRRSRLGQQRETDVLAFVQAFKTAHGVAPTLAEISASVGCVQSVVRFHLIRLQEDGVLKVYAFIPRGIVIVKGKQHA